MEFLSGLPPIDFEPTPATSEDLVVLASDDGTDDDPTQPSAKRRRIEEMARDYSLGIPLFIASASLRGPFSDHRTSVWAPTGSSSRKRLPTKQRTNLAPVNKESVRDAIVENRAQKLESADKATRNEGRVTAQHLPEALTKAAPKAELVEQSVLAMLDGNQSHNGLSRRVRRTTEDEAERIVDDLNPTQIRLTSLAKQHVDRETKSKTDQGASRPELWLKAVKGSTYSRRFAQENGTIVSPQIMAEPIPNRTPVAEDDDIRSACSRRTPTGPAPTVEELDLTSFNPIEEFEELENPPVTPWPQPADEDDAQDRVVKLPSVDMAHLPVDEEDAAVLVTHAELAEVSAKTIQSWMRAKELSVLAASQASQSASLQLSRSPSTAMRPRSAYAERIVRNRSGQATYGNRIPSASEDPPDRTLSLSLPLPARPRETGFITDRHSFSARLSTGMLSQSERRKSTPSTDLSGSKDLRSYFTKPDGTPLLSGILDYQDSRAIRGHKTGKPSMLESSMAPPGPEFTPLHQIEKAKATDQAEIRVNMNHAEDIDPWEFVDETTRKPVNRFTYGKSRAVKTTGQRLVKPAWKVAAPDQSRRRSARSSGAAENTPEGLPARSQAVGPASRLGQAGGKDRELRKEAYLDRGLRRANADGATTTPTGAHPKEALPAKNGLREALGEQMQTNPPSRRTRPKKGLATPNRTASPGGLFVERSTGSRSPSAEHAHVGPGRSGEEFINTQMRLDAGRPLKFSPIRERGSRTNSARSDEGGRPTGIRRSVGAGDLITRGHAETSTIDTTSSLLRDPQPWPRPIPADFDGAVVSGVKGDGLSSRSRRSVQTSREQEEMELKAAIDDLMDGGILSKWSVETALQQSAAVKTPPKPDRPSSANSTSSTGGG